MIAFAGTPPAVYTENLARGGLLLAEMRTLLAAWQPGEPVPDFAQRVRRDDLLGKPTARTVDDYVRAFARRFLTPTDAAARHLQRLTSERTPRQVLADLVFYYIVRQDALLRDFVVRQYWPAAREGRPTLSIDDARRFIWEAEQDGRIPAPWSDRVRKDMPARVLNALGRFGLLGPLEAGRRPILAYRPADGTVAYLSYLLHSEGITDASLAEQSVWLLFGLQPGDVWNRLEFLAGDGWLALQRAGEVVRISWPHRSLGEVVDALAR